MDKSPRIMSEQDWATCLDRFSNFNGSMAEFCRANGISYESLRIRNKEKLRSTEIESAPALPSFVKVEPTRTEALKVALKKSSPQPLPDPEWLATFIHKMMELLK